MQGRIKPVVLLVDDCVQQRDLYELALGRTVHILTASRGEEALSLARTHRPDVIVLDVLMPGLDGWEVCHRLKADPATSSIPVIMLTEDDNEDVPTLARAVGAVTTLAKPCSADRLLATIMEL